ncbi:MAG: hypothetical protein MJZ05_13845 [Fibrobacter sp.]|nr:hypothetical protein [Fibrobacter sp.]
MQNEKARGNRGFFLYVGPEGVAVEYDGYHFSKDLPDFDSEKRTIGEWKIVAG